MLTTSVKVKSEDELNRLVSYLKSKGVKSNEEWNSNVNAKAIIDYNVAHVVIYPEPDLDYEIHPHGGIGTLQHYRNVEDFINDRHNFA